MKMPLKCFGSGCFERVLLFLIFCVLSIHRLIDIRNMSLSDRIDAYLENQCWVAMDSLGI
jgi:hypothetical protein